jgi:hypothetical protein
MAAAYFLLALVGGGFVLLALLNLSFPRVRGPARLGSTRAEAVRSWRSPDGETAKGRVLLVGRPSRDRRMDEVLLREAGYHVQSCAGPEGSVETFPYGGCLLLNEEQCPLSSGADAIVFGLELDGGAARSVLRGYRATRPDIPLCVRTSERESQWYAELLRDCRVARVGREDDLVGLVEDALGAERTRVS